MSWTCVQVEERLSDYLDNTLTHAERIEFREHLDSCSRCAPLFTQVSRITERLRSLELESEPPALVSRILDQTLGPRKAKREWFGWIATLWQPRFATGIVTVLATLLILLHATGVKPSELTLASFNPVNIFESANRRAHLAFARSVKFVNDLRLVHEIQSGLQPAASPAPNQQAPSATPSQQQPKPPHESQRNAAGDGFSVVAAFFANVPGRSAP
jgi:anti-sigma factor RsiW